MANWLQIFIMISSGLLLSPNYSFSQLDKKDISYNLQKNSGSISISIDSTLQLFTPLNKELSLAKEIAINYLDSMENHRVKRKYGRLFDAPFESYYRQYVGFVDKKGNKKVFINAICNSYGKDLDFKNEWIFVLDGGICFFQIEINLDTKKVTSFSVNGEA